MKTSTLRQRLIAGITVILGITNVASAQETDDGRRLVENFVNDVRTLAGRFEQQLVDADNIVVDRSSGTIEIKKPGKFRWTYLEPYEQILVADGLNVWSYDVELEQVTVKPQEDVLASTPAQLLGGSQNVLEDFEYIGSFRDRDTVWVQLEPKSSENGFTKVELGFGNGQLAQMIFSDDLGQTTLIVLFDVELNNPIDEGRFSFTPPENVDVVGQPVSNAPAAR